MRIPSPPEVYRSIEIPRGLGWRTFLAFAGPGYLVSVGYMDPGNWATDIAGGSRFGYTLLSVILLSNLMAILLQSLCVRLGVGTGRDLAQACRDYFPWPVAIALWVLCEVAIVACDLAELLGSALALNLLFGIPMALGVCLTALDVLVLLVLQNKGFRYTEAVVVVMVLTVACASASQLVLSRPELAGMAGGLIPRPEMSPTRRCSTSPWASSARRSCRTTSTCTRRSCRPAPGTSRRRIGTPPSSSPPSTRRSR